MYLALVTSLSRNYRDTCVAYDVISCTSRKARLADATRHANLCARRISLASCRRVTLADLKAGER
jgi:hypothetical protein